MIVLANSRRPLQPTYGVASVNATIFTSTTGSNDWQGRPCIIKLANGNFVVVWKESTQHVLGVPGMININFSANDGVTWTANNVKIGGGAVSGFPYIKAAAAADRAEDIQIFQCPNGDIIMITHEQSSSAAPNDWVTLWQHRSTDNGNTWTSDFDLGLNLPDVPDTIKIWACFSNMTIGTDVYICAAQYDVDFDDSKVTLWKSTDNCLTYTKVSDIFDYDATTPDPNECGIVHIRDGRVLAICRTRDLQKTIKRESIDYGVTWGTIQDYSNYFGRVGIHEPRLYKFPIGLGSPNRIFLAGRNYAGASLWKNWIQFSDDNGLTWRPVYLDTMYVTDAGYVTVVVRSDGQLCCLAYTGSQTAARIVRYILVDTPV